jgi:hypothetical protein
MPNLNELILINSGDRQWPAILIKKLITQAICRNKFVPIKGLMNFRILEKGIGNFGLRQSKQLSLHGPFFLGPSSGNRRQFIGLIAGTLEAAPRVSHVSGCVGSG